MTNHSAVNRSPDQLKSRIQQRQARVGIIGLGYVGLPFALLFSEQKFAVTGFDIDQRKVDTLAQGRLLHLPHRRRRNSGGQGAGLFGHLRLRQSG